MKDLIKHVLVVKSLSKSEFVKVGCLIRDKDGVIFYGYNGHHYVGELETNGLTNPGVIHAETDAIASAGYLDGASMLVTLAPCINCAAIIANTGIKELYYIDPWWDVAAIKLLENRGLKVTRLRIPRTNRSVKDSQVV